MAADYKDTLFLPATDFAMKAKLPEREPQWLERWQKMDLYRRLREKSAGQEKFILHDGPPYANGHLHMGTAMNKILKDIINRTQQMLGRDAVYVPGWDCHGLPIEWQIEKKYREAGKNKDDVPVVEFRAECRQYAQKWLDIQREEFKRLGVEGDWDNPYVTMSFEAEAQIVAELQKFIMNDGLYLGSKPVMWSVVEKTALAEAEVEYHDHTSTQIDVAFPVVEASHDALEGAAIVIWTTTPWTIPGNRAIAYGRDIDYVVIEIEATDGESRVAAGARLAVAKDLLEQFCTRAGITGYTEQAHFTGAKLDGTVCRHPWHGRGYDFDVPLLAGDHVTTETGTGFVHTAPGHGQEDYEVSRAHGIEVPHTVAENGCYFDHVPLFAGIHVFKADDRICDELGDALLARSQLTHSYPHSWRSKAPLIFRNTLQWFISMQANDLRQKALRSIDEDVAWHPAWSARRIRSMIESRPDWVISRQRAWGVPIPVFYHKDSKEILKDERVNTRIVEAIRKHGADIWFAEDPKQFLGDDYDAEEWEAVSDILDVWFDSGSTHAFVLEQRDDLAWPADMYLEGTDQHRGWFHSSLLEACGTRGRAPYKSVLTHGFVVDGNGRKMSKSLGNVVSPLDIIKDHGADILRLWVVSTDYSEDVRIGPDIIKAQVDSYRKIRNTLRFILGNLNGFDEKERLDYGEMPELERWVLHRLSEMDARVRAVSQDHNFHRLFSALYNFCTGDLSAFYFDIRKDALYCDPRDSIRRRAARTVLDELFSHLTAWLAPVLCFTAEEAWLTRHDDPDSSVHLRTFPDVPDEWRDDALAEKWRKIRSVRTVVTGALEIERAEKRIGASLQAHPQVFISDETLRTAVENVNFDEVCITSGITIDEGEGPKDAYRDAERPGIAVSPGLASGEKCQRCWMILQDVGQTPGAPDLCGRCAAAVAAHKAKEAAQ